MELELADRPQRSRPAGRDGKRSTRPSTRCSTRSMRRWGDRDSGHERLGGIVDELVTSLGGHLKHEESEGLALIDSTLNQEQWSELCRACTSSGSAPDVGTYLPWLLDSATEAWTEKVLSSLPPARGASPMRVRGKRPYAELDLWAPETTG